MQERSDRIESENAVLQDELGELTADNTALAPFAVGDRLLNTDVGIIAVRGVDEDRIDETVDVLRQGGAP